MSETKSNASKIEEGRGKGSGASYKPWIQTREISSCGTCSNPKDWKTGRTVELLSQGEAYFWHMLRWDDNILDIREQYPLDLELTNEIGYSTESRASSNSLSSIISHLDDRPLIVTRNLISAFMKESDNDDRS